MWLCRNCFRPVGLADPRCPRCRRHWPAVRAAAVLRHAAVAVLFGLLLVGAVRLARWAALGV